MNAASQSWTTKLSEDAIRGHCAKAIAGWNVRGRRILAIVPDQTRTAPMNVVFPILHELLAADVEALDVLIALGTHPSMTQAAMHRHLGLSRLAEGAFAKTRCMNHQWSSPDQLVSVGTIGEDEVFAISGGRMRERVSVTINKMAFDYDLLLIVGPTFPHEVVGFSGGNKYLVPGISGREIIDMFHWLGALLTSPSIIGTKYTPVRKIVDLAASMIPIERKCLSLVVLGTDLVGLYSGSPEEAWSQAADHSSHIHVRRETHAYKSVLSCAPVMYDELWVGGKCAYKLEPVVADDGELIIYAPHIARLSLTHGDVIERVGYHVRDYFVKQPSRFTEVPRGVLAHSTHVKGAGTYESGVETPRIRVSLATQLTAPECRAINLGYRDFRDIDVAEWAQNSDPGVLCVPNAGEILFCLSDDATRRTGDRSARASSSDPPSAT